MRHLFAGLVAFAVCGFALTGAYAEEESPSVAAASKNESYVFSDDGYLRVRVVSVKRTGNKIDLTLTYENLTNVDHRMAIYNGGANGRDTMLIDNEGDTWEMLKGYKGGAKGPADKIFLPGMEVKVPITFVKETGSLDATSFTLINHVHIVASAGATSNPHWSKVIIKDIPSTYSR